MHNLFGHYRVLFVELLQQGAYALVSNSNLLAAASAIS